MDSDAGGGPPGGMAQCGGLSRRSEEGGVLGRGRWGGGGADVRCLGSRAGGVLTLTRTLEAKLERGHHRKPG